MIPQTKYQTLTELESFAHPKSIGVPYGTVC
jgi:hypothetical protein